MTKIYRFSAENLCLTVIILSFVSFIWAREIQDNPSAANRIIEEKEGKTKNKEVKSDFETIKLEADGIRDIADNKKKAGNVLPERSSVNGAFTLPKRFKQPENKSGKLNFFDTEEESRLNNPAKQSDDVAEWEIPRGSIEYGVEFGYAPDIATWMSGPKIWDISGHKQLAVSVRWGRILGTKGFVTFSYAFEFAPISLAIGNEVINKDYTPGSTTQQPTKRETTYGFHINPASFRFIFLPQWRLRPFIGSGIGPAYHVKPVPIPEGSRWNLLIDFQIGGQYMLSKTRAVQFGYRYYHLSNVYLSDYNPGYNTNMYFIGYSIFKK